MSDIVVFFVIVAASIITIAVVIMAQAALWAVVLGIAGIIAFIFYSGVRLSWWGVRMVLHPYALCVYVLLFGSMAILDWMGLYDPS